ncbi:ABC transporter ATP-binding protein [Pseudomonas sp. JS3066]|jgi:branched-chain amino acid transport system ATP-binding protein|uniref:ABC transporter ATP-binding protein n=1 Tax=unclassified Pseudomonas TaxID=196821 RepID=UPI000EA91385|nr:MULTISPECIES: ABC transporter ATP-binding protein [unclassified Pseudomonas]AYF86584.1 ABC transporter ATP-binding protein [Pseudomonas sp. DY-1]MDH4654677.1 ABC transporter ATP-binding protein [Pseudomonas sp. BN606]MRK23938.1 ABC transporter ATP-binding protein [Pseudomonas sp. JG-B]WVK95945.1 ABC transporter ATP-binding protein [Pseudomonas sp. JS3066]
MQQLLVVEQVHKSYGSVKVTDDLSLALAPGEALGIIGPNGAGKSTLFNLIAGGVAADSGRIHFQGEDVTREPVFKRCQRGIGRSHQIPHPFVKMTVFENLLVGATFGAGQTEKDSHAWCAHVLELTGLIKKANALAGSLTLLERKRLEMARALATRPQLLLLDEIAGGLTEPECLELVGTIQGIHRSGTAIIWIEHIVHALLAVVGRLAVINFGRKLDEGEPHAVMANPKVQEIYMGIGS